MKVELKSMPELRLATLQHLGPYDGISDAFTRLHDIVGSAGLVGRGLAALYHDDPQKTPASQLRSDAALVVSEDAKLPAELLEKRLAAGLYACTTHVGPYEQLGDVWRRFVGEWLPASGRRMSDGLLFELYQNTPQSVPPSELVTELRIPVEP
jgi:AraC family transcriptional regulator